MIENTVDCSSKYKTIGSVSLEKVVALARYLAAHGGPVVAQHVSSLCDLQIVGHDVIRTTTQNGATREPRLVVSSGGTTGHPKLTFVSYQPDMYRIFSEWPALMPGDTMINLFPPGRMWGAHYFLQAIALYQGAGVIPVGGIGVDEVGDFASTFEATRANVICATPTGVYDFCKGLKNCGSELKLSKILWAGEAWNSNMRAQVSNMYPQAEFWGMYASIETTQIGMSFPDCDDGIFHLMSDQLLELAPDGALLTRVGTDWAVPVVRYRLGDRIEAAECRCGRDHAFRILGRSDDAVRFRGTLFSIGEIAEFVLKQTGAPGVQILLEGNESNAIARSMKICVLGKHDELKLKAVLSRHFLDLDAAVHTRHDLLEIENCSSLKRNTRTNKTPLCVWS